MPAILKTKLSETEIEEQEGKGWKENDVVLITV